VGTPAEIVFLTSNEGDALAYLHGFASFKIPSRSVAASCGLDPVRHLKISKQWVWNAVNLLSPEILIVDTFPFGGFQELFDVLDLGARNIFIYRAVRPEMAERAAFQSALRGYHRILMPGEQGVGNDSPVPEDLRDRVVPVRDILIRSNDEVFPRAAARAALGLPAADGADAVYLSVGGGGDTAAEEILERCIAAARLLPDVRFVVGAGPLYRGREFAAPNVAWTRRPVMVECFNAFDAAVVAGGYNTVAELMHCGVPCVFLPQPRSHDDQGERVRRCVEAGAGLLPEGHSTEAIAAALRRLLEPEARAAASRAASALVPVNDALRAAEEILNLIVDPWTVEDAALLAAPAQLAAVREAGIVEADYLTAAHVFWRSLGGAFDEEGAAQIADATRSYLWASNEQGTPADRALRGLTKAARAFGAAETVVDFEPRGERIAAVTDAALAILAERQDALAQDEADT
jgi:predicted glycosyltransferase